MIRWLTVPLLGCVLLVAVFLLSRRPGHAPIPPGPRPGERIDRVPTTPVRPTVSTDNGEDVSPTVSDSPTDAPPPRPAFSKLTREVAGEVEKYLKELWLYQAAQTKAEVDELCAHGGTLAALQKLRERVLGHRHLDPEFSRASQTATMDAATLSRFDFAGWFREFQLVKLIPYIAQRGGDSETACAAGKLLLQILDECPDSLIASAAASALSNESILVTPGYSQVGTHAGAELLGLDFDMNTNADYNSIRGFSKAQAVLADLSLSIIPMIKTDPEMTANIARILQGTKDIVVRRLLLEGIGQLADASRYAPLFQRFATDRSEALWIREAALDLLKDSPDSPQLRETFETEIVGAGTRGSVDVYERTVFLDRLPAFYPAERRYSDRVAAMVAAKDESMEVRIAATKALLTYFSTQMRVPEYQKALTDVIVELGEQEEWAALSEVSDKVTALGVRELLPAYRQILTHHELRSNKSPELIRNLQAIQGWVDTLGTGKDQQGN